jgi:hypothetical protein
MDRSEEKLRDGEELDRWVEDKKNGEAWSKPCEQHTLVFRQREKTKGMQ